MAFENLKQWIAYKTDLEKTCVEEEIFDLIKELKKETGILKTLGMNMADYALKTSGKVDVLGKRVNGYKGKYKEYFERKLNTIRENDKMNLGYYPQG